MEYFYRMSEIEERFYEIWKDMTLNDSLTPLERSKLAVWDFPVSDKYSKIWQTMQEAGLVNNFFFINSNNYNDVFHFFLKFQPTNLKEAVKRVRLSTPSSGFALVADATDVYYLEATNCDLKVVGNEFSRKPYAIAVQKGSPIKEQLDSA